VSTQESKPENDQGDCSRRKERSMKKRLNPAKAHTQSRQRGAQTTSRSFALVRGRSTQFIANPCRWPQRPCPETRLHFCHFPAVFGSHRIGVMSGGVKLICLRFCDEFEVAIKVIFAVYGSVCAIFFIFSQNFEKPDRLETI